MKIIVKRQKIVEEEVEVDNRVYADDTLDWKMANIISDNRLLKLIDDLYDDKNSSVVIDAANTINRTFNMVDSCKHLMEKKACICAMSVLL